jgi:hypothetical protein
MNNNDLNAISNELLTAFFNKSDHTELIRIADRYQIPITGKIFKKATERAIGWLESGDTTVFDVLTPENRDRIIANGLKNISDKYGAVLGKDYSKVDDGILIGNDLLSRIVADMSPKERSEFQGKGFAKKVNQDPFKMLEESLGVPFFTKLEAIGKLRASTLTDSESGFYIGVLADAIGRKHSWIPDDWGMKFAHSILGKERLMLVVKTDTDTIPGDRATDIKCFLFEDLLIALGDEDPVKEMEFSDGEVHPAMSLAQMRLLDKVIRFEEYSFAHIASELEAQLKRK